MSQQSRMGSLFEQLLNVGSGFVVSCVLWELVIKPVWHLQTDFAQNIQITLIFTVASVVRGYLWRRFFVRLARG